MSVEEEIRKLIAADGRTKAEIAEAAGLHSVNLSQFMAGSRGLPLKRLQQLAKVLGAKITVAKKAK